MLITQENFFFFFAFLFLVLLLFHKKIRLGKFTLFSPSLKLIECLVTRLFNTHNMNKLNKKKAFKKSKKYKSCYEMKII